MVLQKSHPSSGVHECGVERVVFAEGVRTEHNVCRLFESSAG